MGVKLRERPGKGWFVLIDWKGQRKAKCFGKNKKLAKDFADKLTTKLKWAEQNGEPLRLSSPNGNMPTVQEYFAEWLTIYAEPHCKISTATDYRRNLKNHVFPAFGSRKLHEVQRTDVKRLIADLVAKGRKKPTIHNILTPLKEGYQHAIDDGLVSINPIANMGRLTKTQEDQRSTIAPLTGEELRQALDEARHKLPLYYPAFLCAARTGLRKGEVIGLQWGDIDFKKMFIEVRRAVHKGRETTTKTRKIRRVDMSQQLADTLRAHKDTQSLEAQQRGISQPEWVFTDEKLNRLSETMLLRVFHRCLDEAGIRRVRFHDLRHSFASLLIQKGANPKYIQEQLGHSSIKVTMDVYGHLFEGDHRHVINLLDDAQEQAESATPPQPTLEVLKPFAYKQLENITN